MQPCQAYVCSEAILACVPMDESMEWGVLTGRADIVLDLLARGVDPDSPAAGTGLLPVEMALQLAKGPRNARTERQASVMGVVVDGRLRPREASEVEPLRLSGALSVATEEEDEDDEELASNQVSSGVVLACT